MSWNGSGVYSRGYPSWSADAAANLPISATKFDTEDNDFASGIGLCLTKDGQSVPNASLSWGLPSGQVLALTRGSDGAVFSIARTGGTNNPSFSMAVTDASGITLSVLGNSALSISNAGVVSFPGGLGSLTGTVTIATPASAGATLAVAAGNGTNAAIKVSGNLAISLQGTDAMVGYALESQTGTIDGATASYYGMTMATFTGYGGPGTMLSGYNGVKLTAGNVTRMDLNGSGNFTLHAPASGTTLIVAGVASNSVAIFGDNTGATTQQVYAGPISLSVGSYIATGYAEVISITTNPLYVGTNQNTSVNLCTQSIARFIIGGDGSLYTASATGGGQGVDTFNANGLYIGGKQIFSGVPASSNTTAALSDRNKMINATGTITVPNSTFAQGDAFSIYNNSGSAITISAGISTMRLAGTTTTGSRTLAPRGMATIWFESGTECIVGGPGVT
nr:hypothetical protein [uncultured Rhodopila sp.]